MKHSIKQEQSHQVRLNGRVVTIEDKVNDTSGQPTDGLSAFAVKRLFLRVFA